MAQIRFQTVHFLFVQTYVYSLTDHESIPIHDRSNWRYPYANRRLPFASCTGNFLSWLRPNFAEASISAAYFPFLDSITHLSTAACSPVTIPSCLATSAQFCSWVCYGFDFNRSGHSQRKITVRIEGQAMARTSEIDMQAWNAVRGQLACQKGELGLLQALRPTEQ